MKKIIFIKSIQLLVIDGIMLAFLTFKGGLTWDWILIYSGWLTNPPMGYPDDSLLDMFKWYATFPSGHSPNPRPSHPFLSHLPKPETRFPQGLSGTDCILEYFMIDEKNQAVRAWSFLSIFSI